MKSKLGVIAFILLIPALYFTLDHFISERGELDLAPAPVLKLLSLDGKTYELNDFSEKIIVLNFWASWCPPCLKELPYLVKIAEDHEEVTILAVLTSDELRKAMPIINGITPPKNFKFMIDYENASKKFGTVKLPETYVIGKNRKIIDKFSGDITLSHRDIPKLIKEYSKENP